MSEAPSAYRRAGVDIDKKYAAVTGATDAIRKTYTEGVVGDVGAFGGLFDPARVGAAGELLVASTDGVGTKVMVSAMAGDLVPGGMAGVGADLVNHSINDILVQGARPLFFLDYIAMAKMDPERVQQIIAGMAAACSENGCALLGGETAEMPGVYRDGEVDVAGTIVGSVARERLLDGTKIVAGDRLIGLTSSGLHTNGYSLARQVLLADQGMKLEDQPEELAGVRVGEALLAVHKSYLKPCLPLVQKDLLHGMAHITGGGLPDNVPRVLPADLGVRVATAAIPKSPICELIVARGKVARDEAYRVLNMGVGMVLFVAAEHVDEVTAACRAAGEQPFDLGEVIERGDGQPAVVLQ
ncbi:MAG: phosphoribosylformylglycinamidine cyclo-ligase [Planctomycetota bacterium]